MGSIQAPTPCRYSEIMSLKITARRFLVGALTCAALIASSRPVCAKYLAETFVRMARDADLIAWGDIVDVDAVKFKLRVQGIAKAERPGEQRVSPGSTIAIAAFRNSYEVKRWTAYRPGQTVFLFLKHSSKSGGPWRIIGAGNEGELPVLGTSVYLGLDLLTQARRYDDVYGAPFLGESVPLEKVVDSVRHLTKPTPNASDKRRHGPALVRGATRADQQ